MRNNNRWTGATIVTMLALLAGCQHPELTHGENLDKSTARTDVDSFTAVQASNGARNDATLRDFSFNGDELNSLGRQKLDLMRQSDTGGPVLVVYVDVSNDTLAARHKAVESYLDSVKVKSAKVIDGPNLNLGTPALNTLPAIYHKEGDNVSGEAADLAMPGGGGAPPAAK